MAESYTDRARGRPPGRHRNVEPQIASQLLMSRSTVKMHLSNVYLKLGIANRTELARTTAMNG
jgi:FixJ family two-component response regulator